MSRELLMMQNNYEWRTAEGQTLEIENAIRSNARDLKIEGQTYQNLNFGVNYTGSGLYGSTFSIDKNIGKYVIKSVDADAYITLKYQNTISKMLKPNTKYTLAFNVDTNFVNYKGITVCGVEDGYYNNRPSINTNTRYFQSDDMVFDSGYKKLCFTTTTINEYFSIGFNTTSTITKNIGDYFQIKDIVILEGDYTNIDLPITLSGIESVAERESKNLFKDEGWSNKHLNNSNNTLRCSNNFRLPVKLNDVYTINYEANNPNLCLVVNGFKADGSYFIDGLNTNWLYKNQMPYSFKITNPEVKSIGFMLRYKNDETISPTSSDVLNSNITVLPNLYTEGNVNVKGKTAYYNVSKTINVNKNTNYNVSANIESISKGDNDFTPVLQVKDNNGALVSINNGQNKTFNSGDNTQLYLKLIVNNSNVSATDCEANFKNIGVYESNSYPIKIAQSCNETDGIVLPNGTKNIIKIINGVLTHIQKIGRVVLTNETPCSFVGTYSPFLQFGTYHNEVKNVVECINDRLPTFKDNEGMGINSTHNHRGISTQAGFRVKPFDEDDKTEEEYRAWLADNPITVYYEKQNYIYTPIEPTEISLPQPLRSLPNGVCDEVVGNKLIQRIGKYTITGNEAFTLRYENDSMFTIECRDLSMEIAFNDYWNSNIKMICDKAVCDNCVATNYITNTLTVCSRTSSLKGFVIAIPKSLLSEYTIDKAKEYIQSLGGMTVYYELGTPIEHTINIPPISISKGSNIITTANNIKPNMSMKVKVKK